MDDHKSLKVLVKPGRNDGHPPTHSTLFHSNRRQAA
jgi:hypothetical protein